MTGRHNAVPRKKVELDNMAVLIFSEQIAASLGWMSLVLVRLLPVNSAVSETDYFHQLTSRNG
jgi:hypothetical protein